MWDILIIKYLDSFKNVSDDRSKVLLGQPHLKGRSQPTREIPRECGLEGLMSSAQAS